MEPMTSLLNAIEQAARQYFRLVILAGPPDSGKTTALQGVAQAIGCQLLNVNLEVSRKMLELPRGQRPLECQPLLKDIISTVPGDVLLLDNLEILFDSALELQPLQLLQALDRNRTIVASWNGSFQGGTLIYAEPGHPEFMQFKQPEAIIITLGDSANN